MAGKEAGGAVRVRALEAGYDKSHILFGVDFEAAPREITVIVGPNGCGKSTLLKSIFGMCAVYSGEILLDGASITGMAPHQVARKRVAYLPQVNNVFANLTIRENLAMAGYTVDRDAAAERLPHTMETFPDLKAHERSKASVLSGGQRQMLAMAISLIRRPHVMLFDEPTAGLSPKLAEQVISKIRQVNEEYGITVILVEQNVRRALSMGDMAYLLASGKNVFSGPPKELLGHPELGRMYLGIGGGPAGGGAVKGEKGGGPAAGEEAGAGAGKGGEKAGAGAGKGGEKAGAGAGEGGGRGKGGAGEGRPAAGGVGA